MAVVYTDVQALSSAFASLTQDRIDPFIARAGRQCNATYYGDQYDDAVLYLAAHMLAEAERQAGATGALSAASVGPLSASYAGAPAGVPSEYASTQFGVRFWAILRGRRWQAMQVL